MKFLSNMANFLSKGLLTTKGDLLKHNGVTPVRMPVGNALEGMRVNLAGDDLEYSPINVALTTKGEMLSHDGVDSIRIPVGNAYETLRVNAAGDDLEYSPVNIMAAATGQAILYKVININDWNMDSTSSIVVNHGVSEAEVILAIAGIIRDDNNINYYTIGSGSNETNSNDIGISSFTDAAVTLSRLTGGNFDNTSFDSTGYNRGRIIVTYSGTGL